MVMFKILTLACIFSTCVKEDPKFYTASKDFTSAFNIRMKDQYNLHMLGWGGVFDNGVNGLYIDYEVCMKPDEKSSGELLEMVMHDLVRAMNRDETLRSHLNQFPVSEKNIGVSIAFVDDLKRVVQPLSQIDFHSDKICYSRFDAKAHTYRIYKEIKYSTK
jgi:hypothetical protein